MEPMDLKVLQSRDLKEESSLDPKEDKGFQEPRVSKVSKEM